VILRDWQEREAADHHDTPKRAMLCEPRTGKTLACIESLKRKQNDAEIMAEAMVAATKGVV